VRQSIAAPLAASGGAIGGIAAVVVGAFTIGDCIRFQSGPGQCNGVVSENVPTIVLGVLATLGTAGGFFTLNPMLERSRKKEDEVAPAALGISLAAAALDLPSHLGKAVEPEPEKKDRGGRRERAGRERRAAEADAQDVKEDLKERVEFMHARGLSDEKIAEATGLSPRRVARILEESADLEPGL
jgi:hypothetical protein